MGAAVPRDGERHLLLGGAGFIGRHVALLLLRAGCRVVIAARRPPEFAFPGGLGPEFIPFEMADTDWDALLPRADVVHHYAWGSLPATANADPDSDLSANVLPTLRLIEALGRCPNPPRLVFASSGGTVYGKLRRVPVPEEHKLAPITAYGAGKAAVELYLGCYRALYGVDCRVARMANPFGAGQNTGKGQGAVSAFAHAALAGRPITIWGDGEVVRDYIHVSDVAEGLVCLARAPRSEGPWTFNLGSGQGVSLNGIVAELEARLDHKLAVSHGPGRAFDVPVSVLDVALARETLGWSPRLSFAEGIARTLDDLRERRAISAL